MPKYPNYENLSDEKKFEILFDWCDALTSRLNETDGHVQLLHERLRKVESASKETSG